MAFLRSHHQKTAFLIVVICLISFVAIGFHHHGDDRQHANCAVCLAGSLFAPGVLESSAFAVYHPVISHACVSPDDHPESLITFSTFAPRAPPSFT